MNAVVRYAICMFVLSFTLQASLACHFLVKGIAVTLRENVHYSDRRLRQNLNHIIHCPNFKQACKENFKHQSVIFHPESLNYMIASGFYREIIRVKIIQNKVTDTEEDSGKV